MGKNKKKAQHGQSGADGHEFENEWGGANVVTLNGMDDIVIYD